MRETSPSDFFDGLAPTSAARPGDVVTVAAEEDRSWPGFALVLNDRGPAGWVPKRYLRREGDQGVVTHGYDTTCLTLAHDETL